MAKVITTELQHASASGANITMDGSKNVTCENNLQVDGNLTVTGTIPAAKLTGALPAISGASLTGISTPLPGRRLNRNGAMQINQRGGQSPAHDASGRLAYEGWGADGYQVQWTAMDELDGTINTVEDGPEGFTHSTKWTTGTAESAIATNEWACMSTKMDSFDVRDHLKWGTANAEALTVSFWVKSSLTGTFYMSIYSPRTSGGRSLSKTYSISSANTREKKTVTFDADTGGNEQPNESQEQSIMWAMASGSQWDSGGSTSSWQDYAHATWLGQNNRDDLITTAGATFYLTGVQAEVGTSATDFEYKKADEELSWCQRYYYTLKCSGENPGRGNGTSAITFTCNLPHSFRGTPSLTMTAGSGVRQYGIDSKSDSTTAPTVSTFRTNNSWVKLAQSGHSGVNDDCALVAMLNGSATEGIEFFAEL